MNFFEKSLRNFAKVSAWIYFRSVYKSKKKSKYIAASGKVLNEKELYNMIDASFDMWLTGGRFNDKFEKEFKKFLGIKYALTVNSGSSANLLALSTLMSDKLGAKKLQKGDEVITVAAGFPTTINPIIQNGLIPVFADIEIGTYNINPAQLEECLSDKTKAVFLAHTLGNPFDLDKVREFCNKNNLWLIEDNCDALGSEFDDNLTGTLGDIATFSFYPAHHITMGEGGAVVTNNSELYKILLSLRDWGRDCWCPPGKDNSCAKRFKQQLGNLPFGYDHKYTYSHGGYNLKITDWQASVGLAQIEKLDDFIQKRRKNFAYLNEKLKKFEDFFILPKAHSKSNPSWFGFLITVKDSVPFKTQELIEFLEGNSVGTRRLFGGNILRQPYFVNNEIQLRIRNSQLLTSSSLTEQHYKILTVTDNVMNNTFWIGVWPGLGRKEIDYIYSKFKTFFKEKGL